MGIWCREVKDFIDKVWTINLKNGKEKIFNNSECKFKYRDSIFKNELKNQYIILHVSFKLSKLPILNTKYKDINAELLNLSLEKSTENIFNVINIRKRKLPDPKEIGNCGSFFKNPVIEKVKFEHLQKIYPNIIGYKISNTKIKLAGFGWLIDQCGWKGYRDNDAGVHKNQALVLVNYGEITGREIVNLSKDTKFGKEKI